MAKVTYLERGPGMLSDYYAWFRDAPHGAKLIYHNGDLAFDRDKNNFRHRSDFDKLSPAIEAIDVAAKRILKDAEDGVLVLTQRRLGPSSFEYRAFRVRKNVQARAGDA